MQPPSTCEVARERRSRSARAAATTRAAAHIARVGDRRRRCPGRGSASPSISRTRTSKCTSRSTSKSCSRSPSASRGAAACPWESRSRHVSPLRRHRLARRRLPRHEARPALRLRPLLRAAVHRARVDLQGVRAGGKARRFQGGSRLFVVPFGARAAGAGDGRRRLPAGDRPAAVDDANGVCARARGRGARHRRLARQGVVPDPAEPRRRGRRRAARRATPRCLGQVRDRGRRRTSARTRSPTFPRRTAAPCSPARSRRRAAPEQIVRLEQRLDVAETVAEPVHGRELVRPRRESPQMQPALQTHYAGNMER